MHILKPVVALLAVAAAGCSAPRFANLQPTPEALAREVLVAIAQRQPERLRALALNEDEFEHRVWRGLPAARPERNLPWSYVWMDLRQKSDATLDRTLRRYAGQQFTVASIRFEGGATDHGDFRVHRETVLEVRDSAGSSLDLRVLGSMIEADTGWKVFSYIVDD